MESHKSIFSLMARNMQAYTISWVTTFFSSIVNVVWSTQVFHFDFVSSIDGALASQIGVVLLNELFLLWSVFISRKYLFGFGAIVNITGILAMAAFILMLIFAPMMAFKAYAGVVGAEIAGHSPLYDAVNDTAGQVLAFLATFMNIDQATFHDRYDVIFTRIAGAISGIMALGFVWSFFRRKKT